MKLKDCTHGRLVTYNGMVGMIVGITNNCTYADKATRGRMESAIPLVQWASGNTGGIHYCDLKIFEDAT